MERESIWVEWGNWLQEQRKLAGLSQQELADKVGMVRTHISDLENGRSGAKRDTVILLAEALECDPSEALLAAGFAPSSLSGTRKELNPELIEIGRRIRARREYLGLSQEQVASQVGIDRSTFANYEAGKIDYSITNFDKIAKALNCPKAYLLGEDVASDLEEEGQIAAFYRGLPPDQQSMIRAMMQAAHEEAKRSETTHGRKAE